MALAIAISHNHRSVGTPLSSSIGTHRKHPYERVAPDVEATVLAPGGGRHIHLTQYHRKEHHQESSAMESENSN